MFIYSAPDNFDQEEHFDSLSLYQGMFFKKWKTEYGQKVISLVLASDVSDIKAYVQCIEYKLPFIGSVWVSSKGPIGSFDSVKIEKEFYDELISKCIEEEKNTSHIRIQRRVRTRNIKTKEAENIVGGINQPIFEKVISLEKEMEDVLSSFSSNTKRAIKRYLADKDNLRVHTESISFNKYFDVVFKLLKESAKLKDFSMHPDSYYESLFKMLDENPGRGSLSIGYVNKKAVSAVLTIYTKGEAYNILSGNLSEGYDDNMPTITMYHSIKDAKDKGLREYNMGAVSLALESSSDSLSNQSMFKEKFGGETVRNDIYRDIVITSWRYYLYRFLRLSFVLRLRRIIPKIYKVIKNEIETNRYLHKK